MYAIVPNNLEYWSPMANTAWIESWMVESGNITHDKAKDIELKVLTNGLFSIVKHPENGKRSGEAIFNCKHCGTNFKIGNYSNKFWGNARNLWCPTCGYGTELNRVGYITLVEFVIDEEYAKEYYARLLALTTLPSETMYYVVKDTKFIIPPLLNKSPHVRYGALSLDIKYDEKDSTRYIPKHELKVLSIVRPYYLTHEYILESIPESCHDDVLQLEQKYKLILQQELADSYIVNFESYEIMKEALKKNEVLLSNVNSIIAERIQNNTSLSSKSNSSSIQSEEQTASTDQFKKYYFHNIPVDVMKQMSGVPDVSGVYILKDSTGKYYVGQGVHCIKRCLDHFKGAPKDDVGLAYANGETFVIEDIIVGIKGQDFIHLDTLEKICIEIYSAKTTGYNKTKGNSSHDILYAMAG